MLWANAIYSIAVRLSPPSSKNHPRSPPAQEKESLPKGCKAFARLCPWGDILPLLCSEIRLWKILPICLSAGGHGHVCQMYKIIGHHVSGKTGCQMASQLFFLDHLFCRVITSQILAAVFLSPVCDCHKPNSRKSSHSTLDLAEFNTQSPELYLGIDPLQIFNLSVCPPPPQISCLAPECRAACWQWDGRW